MFSILFHTLTQELIPWMLLKPRQKAWIDSLIDPLDSLYQIFLSFRNSMLFDAAINGQVMNLEYMLNLEFYADGLLTNIYITDDNAVDDRTILYNQDENQPETYIFNANESEPKTYLFNSWETSSGVGFVVHVPVALVFDESFMKSKINKYKLAGTTYRIQTY